MKNCKQCDKELGNRRIGTMYCSKKCKNAAYQLGLKNEREGVKTVEKKPLNPMFLSRGKIQYGGVLA